MKNWRVNLVLLLMIIFSTVIIGRLIYLQIVKYQYWRALAHGQQRYFEFSQRERGEIFFRENESLAINKNFNLIYASSQKIENLEEAAEILSSILNLDKNLILEKFKEDGFYKVIKRNLTEEEVSKLKEINLKGVHLGREVGRYYPFQDLASHVVGFLGGEGQGQYGIEGFYNDILTGKDMVSEKIMGPGGFFRARGVSSVNESSDIVLTLDYNIQLMAEKLLKEAKENIDIEEGEIIVIDPNSGRILALAVFPSFNPNKYYQVSNFEIFKNSAVQKVFEPGSVFKPITMAAALDQGVITPETTFYDEGFVRIGGHTIRNYNNRVWGEQTMTEVLEKSINTGTIFVQRQMENRVFLDYLNRFGIFKESGIDLQGEVFSLNKEFKEGHEVNFATASYGHGIKMNSLQLVRAFSVIANGGKLIRPFIVDKILEDNNKIIETQIDIQNSSVISKNTASDLTMMLISKVENGFAKSASVPGYYVAGKTGTAQIPWPALGINKRGYSDKTIQSFIGYAPALNPKFLILVKLNNPKTRDASVSAAPIFSELAEYILKLWQILPDYSE